MSQLEPAGRASGIGLLVALLACSIAQADEPLPISEAQRDDSGLLIHKVRSSYQSGTTEIRVLRPDRWEEGKKYSVVYVLPVEAGTDSRYGDGMQEIKALDLHNAWNVVFVGPTFSHLPWYADHPSKPEIRQESYFLKVVLPLIENSYPVRAEPEGRLLLGFSKSGWGAWTLLLRHPDLFKKAVAWDAPLMMDAPGKYGSGDIFGTPENFQSYRISELLVQQAARFRKEKRLVLLGYGSFRSEHVQAHMLMDQWQIAHEYRDGPERQHDWHSGWVKEAVEVLLKKPVPAP